MIEYRLHVINAHRRGRRVARIFLEDGKKFQKMSAIMAGRHKKLLSFRLIKTVRFGFFFFFFFFLYGTKNILLELVTNTYTDLLIVYLYTERLIIVSDILVSL